MTNFASIGFPRGVGRHAPKPDVAEPLVPRIGFPRLSKPETAEVPVLRQIPWVGMPLADGYDDIPF